ncbi:MAG TPA: alpha/beta fold hydrolase [Burkholderiaceae bacterium]|nr:alpha/beta fold hydrolase [Burkholderiaceae bacterium]
MARVWALFAVAAGAYVVLLAALWWGQERLLFLPTPLAPEYRMALERDVHERFIAVPGARLHALHLNLPAPRGMVFFLHGNAGNLESWFVDLDVYRRANFDVFMLDYRGYGKSSGRIESEQQLHADVRAAWDAVAPEYAGMKRVLLGRSLGTGLAVPLALQVQPELTVLVSPYSSLRAMAAEHYPWVPGFMLRYPLATDAAIAQLRTPLLLLHGARDDVIAPRHSEVLKRLQPQARLRIVKDAGHNDLQAFDEYRTALRAALDAL